MLAQTTIDNTTLQVPLRGPADPCAVITGPRARQYGLDPPAEGDNRYFSILSFVPTQMWPSQWLVNWALVGLAEAGGHVVPTELQLGNLQSLSLEFAHNNCRVEMHDPHQ